MDPNGTVSGIAMVRWLQQSDGRGITHPQSDPDRAAMAASVTGENGLRFMLEPCFPYWTWAWELRDLRGCGVASQVVTAANRLCGLEHHWILAAVSASSETEH